MRPHLLAVTAIALVALAGSAIAQEGAPAEARPVPPVVEAWAAAWNAADAEGMAALFTEDGTYEDLAFQVRFQGREGVAAWVGLTAEAIPDARIAIVDAFQAGDRVAVRWVLSGTPGALGSTPLTGESFEVPAVSILVMDGELIESATDVYNLAELLRDVGLPSGPWVPPPAPDRTRAASAPKGGAFLVIFAHLCGSRFGPCKAGYCAPRGVPTWVASSVRWP